MQVPPLMAESSRQLFGGRAHRRSLDYARDDKGEGGVSMGNWLVAERVADWVRCEAIAGLSIHR